MTAYPDFKGCHIMITGAGAGIGRAIARAFLDQGAIVAALDRDEEGLAETLRPASSGKSVSIVCDLADVAATEAAFSRACSEIGAPAVLVNNAGNDDRRPFDEITGADWRRALAINLDHHFVLAKCATPGMREAGGGVIVGLSSTAWMKMAENLTSYHAAKAGIVGLTRGLARELGPDNIRVNAIAPGRVVTERVRDEFLTPAWEAETKQLQCIPKLITPADVANVVVFLASSQASQITGQTIVVDGGVV